MKMFRKYQLASWQSIQNFYSHFTKVTRKCECFNRIVEPCPRPKALGPISRSRADIKGNMKKAMY